MVKSEVQRRNIGRIVHFTKVENLPSILSNGLLSRDSLGSKNIQYQCNDEVRADYQTDASCMSICFPNYKMFYTYKTNEKDQKWAVLSFQPRLLWEKECAFCYQNAASSEISSISINNRKQPSAFLEMFSDFDQFPDRSKLGVPLNYPTNPQAEVLVFGDIDISYLQAVNFFDYATYSKYVTIKPDSVIFNINTEVFYGRSDYKHWQETNTPFSMEDLFK